MMIAELYVSSLSKNKENDHCRAIFQRRPSLCQSLKGLTELLSLCVVKSNATISTAKPPAYRII